jgi:hypothetical protein
MCGFIPGTFQFSERKPSLAGKLQLELELELELEQLLSLYNHSRG